MDILTVTSMYFPARGNWVAEQVRSLRSLGLGVSVVYFDTERKRSQYALRILDIMRELKLRRYDLIHTHHTYTFVMVEIAKSLIRSTVPVVLTNHEAEILDQDGRARTWHPTSLLRHSLGIKRFAVRRADFVIFVARKLVQVLGCPGPHAIIPCGVDLAKFRPLDQRECRRRLNLPEEGTVVFFPANPRWKRKRFDLAKMAWEIVRQRDPGCILLTGGDIPADDMPVYYNAANVVVQTSLSEASPTVVKEALACEIPVVSTDAGDTREVLNGVSYCSLSPENPDELANRILAVRGHRAVGGRRQLLRKRMSLDQVSRRVLRVYEQVLQAQRPRVHSGAMALRGLSPFRE